MSEDKAQVYLDRAEKCTDKRRADYWLERAFEAGGMVVNSSKAKWTTKFKAGYDNRAAKRKKSALKRKGKA